MEIKSTKEIIKQCKQLISSRYEQYLLSPDAIKYAKCRMDIEQILGSHLALYAQRDPEMQLLLEWVGQFQDQTLSENIDCLETHVMQKTIKPKDNKVH